MRSITKLLRWPALLALALAVLLPAGRSGPGGRRDAHRLRRHRLGRDPRLPDRHRACEGARRRRRGDLLQVGGSRRSGGGRRPGRHRGRHALRAAPEGQGADPDLLPARQPALLPDGRHREVPELGGSRRRGGRGPLARLRHRGDHEPDGAAPRHHLQQHELRAGLGGARRRHAPGQHPRHHRRCRQSPGAAGEGRRPLRGAADGGRQRQRRGALRQRELSPGERRCRSTSWSRSCSRRGARSTRTRATWSRSASSTTCCPTCRRSSRRRSCPTTRRPRRPAPSPTTAGGEAAAKDDFEFYALAGQLEGDPAELKVEDFWDLGPLQRALDKLGQA